MNLNEFFDKIGTIIDTPSCFAAMFFAALTETRKKQEPPKDHHAE